MLKLRVSKVARIPGPAGVSAGCRRVSVSSAGKHLLQEEEELCVSSAGECACRAADIEHLGAGSVPGTPVGRAVVLKTQNFDNFSPLFGLFT